jgi:hypothetical protein
MRAAILATLSLTGCSSGSVSEATVDAGVSLPDAANGSDGPVRDADAAAVADASVKDSGPTNGYPDGTIPTTGMHWYVSSAGIDKSSCGSANAPCATITYVDSNRVAPGDVVHVSGSFKLTNASCIQTSTTGTMGAPITYFADPRGSAKIDGNAACFYVWHSTGGYQRVLGFDFTGAQTNPNTNNGTVVFMAEGAAGHVEFAYNTVHDLPSGLGAATDFEPYGNGSYTGAPCSVHHNVFHDIGYGGGLQLGDYAMYIACGADSWVYDNLVYREGSIGMHLWHAADHVHLVNNTIDGAQYVGILVGTGDSGGVSGATFDVTNNVVTSSHYGIMAEANAPATISSSSVFRNNLVHGNQIDWYYDDQGADSAITTAMMVSGTVTANPAYLAPASGDFHVSPNSPAIDTGSTQGAPTNDLDGFARPYGAGFDIGAYEWHP